VFEEFQGFQGFQGSEEFGGFEWLMRFEHFKQWKPNETRNQKPEI